MDGDRPTVDSGLLEAARRLRRNTVPAVLATLVAVEGSSVRRPGARLLILPDGTTAGFLSAGCVERDLAARVERVLTTGRCEVVRYLTGEAADPVLGLGLGCGGGMTVLLEPWPPGSGPDPLDLAEMVRRRRRPVGLATVVSPPELAGTRAASGAGAPPPAHTRNGGAAALETLARQGLRGAEGLHRAGGMEVFVERIVPPFRVLVQGLTPPALAFARLAGALGWEAILLPTGPVPDGVSIPPGAALLPAADRALPQGFEPDPWTAAVLLAHDTAAEARILPALLSGGVCYAGVMGSRGRRRQLLDALVESGIPGGMAAEIHMPVGLDIGAESAEEIALAAAAEIVAVLRGREGGRLSRGEGPVHAR